MHTRSFCRSLVQRWAWGALLCCAFSLGGCSLSQSSQTHSPTPIREYLIDRPVPTTGCGKLPTSASGTTVPETLVSNGISRAYLLHLPTGYQREKKQPLILYFHSSSRPSPTLLSGEEQMSGFSVVADHDDVIAVYPEGTISPYQRIRWSTGSSEDPKGDDVLFVSDLLNHLQAILCIDEHRIYATGFSSGGGMTGVLACSLTRRIAAFAPVSGAFFISLPGGCHPSRPVPILDIHGTDDEKVPYVGDPRQGLPPIQQWLQDWASRDGCSRGPTTFFTRADVIGEQWSACQDNVAVIHYRIIGGRHAWPTTALQAPNVIWQFFQHNPLA